MIVSTTAIGNAELREPAPRHVMRTQFPTPNHVQGILDPLGNDGRVGIELLNRWGWWGCAGEPQDQRDVGRLVGGMRRIAEGTITRVPGARDDEIERLGERHSVTVHVYEPPQYHALVFGIDCEMLNGRDVGLTTAWTPKNAGFVRSGQVLRGYFR